MALKVFGLASCISASLSSSRARPCARRWLSLCPFQTKEQLFPERPLPHLSHITTFLERLVPVQGRGRTELIELAKFSPSVDISRSARLRRLVIIDRSISAQTIWCSKYTDGRTLPEHQTPNSDHGRGPALGGCTGYETGKHEGLEMDSASECCVFAP